MLIIYIGGLVIGVLGCAPVTSTSTPQPQWNRSIQTGEAENTNERQSPRALASLRLTEQGRLFLEDGNPDDAIRTLEQALNLDPINGQNYYYLSEAWLMKGNKTQAAEFNRLAAIYLEDDNQWMDRVSQQKERIKRQQH